MLRSLLVFALLALALPLAVLAAGRPTTPAAEGSRAPARPSLSGPADGARPEAAPVFSWRPVRGAATYEFQLSADSGFRSIVSGGSSETRNTSYTLERSLPDGEYRWRVRAVNAKGDAGRWSGARSLVKRWSARPTLVAPADDASVQYPSTPLVLRWDPVPHAVKYIVTIAADPALASPVLGSVAQPVETSGTALAPPGSLNEGRYWWAVTPVNAVGHRGARSAIDSFEWVWPTGTATRVTDLNPHPAGSDSASERQDPQFSWDRVPGAARYEVEVNASADFAAGSKVCCADRTIGTSLSPVKLFESNVHFWRVRAIDANGKTGQWNEGPAFAKVFDKPPAGTPSVPGLHLRDNQGPLALGSTTTSPVLDWAPAHGASSYVVRVVPYTFGVCDWGASAGSWTSETATTAWTPLTGTGGGSPPVPFAEGVANEGDKLAPGGKYCARVTPRTGTDTTGDRVVSHFTQLGDTGGPAFTYASGTGSSTGLLMAGDGDYLRPLPDDPDERRRMPLFTWKHIAGACGYFVVVARDPSFTTIIDVARTKVPAYAPRRAGTPRTYTDEATRYYWAVVPVNGPSCTSVSTAPQDNSPHVFDKRSDPPLPSGPADGADVIDQPTFRWGAAEGAREYRLQVAHDPAFGSLIDDVVTASTAYTSSSTYPADALLYWRVRANDENGVGLTWSPTRTFRRRLPTPAVGANPDGGEGIPVLSWSPVPGAISYDVNVEEPDGDNLSFNMRSTVFTPVKTYGLGVWQWRVRANFPAGASGTSSGGFSPKRPFARFMNPPTGAHAMRAGGGLVVKWDPSFALAKNYRVEFAETSSFTRMIDSKRVDNAAYAPTLMAGGFQNGGRLYWRVAAVDEGGNTGAWASGRVGLLRRMNVTATGGVARGRRGTVEVRVTDAKGRAVRRARATLRGAGIPRRSARTSKRGVARFRVRPRARGRIVVRVDKRGYRPGSASVTVG